MHQEVEKAISLANAAQRRWCSQLARHRFRLIGRIAHELVKEAQQLAHLIDRPAADTAEKLASEILPLADACHFASKLGRRILAPDTKSWRYGAWWMGRVAVQVSRQPWGVVLIISPSNYPLYLPAVQAVQALAAGNAVLIKPAPGHAPVLHHFHRTCLVTAGIEADLLQILDADAETAQTAIRAGVNKIVLTGSVAAGRSVLHAAADTLTPTTMELSGCDAVFVSPQADLDRVAGCVAFALRLNGGATCIAPRRIFVTPGHAEALISQLGQHLESAGATDYMIPPQVGEAVRKVVQQALADGARIVWGTLPTTNSTDNRMRPLVLADVRPEMRVACSDLFAPLTSILNAVDMPSAIEMDRHCPYSLGASVFGPSNHAAHWARQIDAGCVVINDLIVPTADPRVSFGGWDQSGWGVTRGAEGLLEMTRPKTICTRRGNWLPHLHHRPQDPRLLLALLKIFHAPRWRDRMRGLREVLPLARRSG